MKTRASIIRSDSMIKPAVVLIALIAGLLTVHWAEALDAITIETIGPAPTFRYAEYENGDRKELQIAFNLGWRFTGPEVWDFTYDINIFHASGYVEILKGRGFEITNGLGPTWHVIRRITLYPTSNLAEATASLLHSLHFRTVDGQEVYDPAIAYSVGYLVAPNCVWPPLYDMRATGTMLGCWCACIPDPVPDCAKPYVPFSVGPLAGTYHNGGAWGGPGYMNEASSPPNMLLGTNASLDYPQLLWSRCASGADIYTFKHGAMQTESFVNVPGLSFPDGILHSSGSALHWTYATATNEHVFVSKSRARVYFEDSGSLGYQRVQRIVAANGVDTLYYKWDGDRPSAIYSSKVAGRSYKTCISYNANGHISSVDEKVVEVSGDWPYTEGDEVWSRTTTVGYTTIGGKEYISTISHPGGLTTAFGYDGGKLTSVSYPYGHSQHFVYSGNNVTEYYEDGALKNNYRTYAFNQAVELSRLDPKAPWSVFYTEVAHRKPDGSVVSRSRRYSDGWRLRGHSAEALGPSGSAVLTASKRVEDLVRGGAGGMIAGRRYGSSSDDFFFKAAVERTEYGSPTNVYARAFSSASSGYSAENKVWARATMEYATPDPSVPHFETLTKLKTYVGRETHAAYYAGAGVDASYKYKLKEIYHNNNDGKKVTYAYYGDSDGDDAGLLKKVTGFDGTKAEYEYAARRVSKVYAWPSSGTRKQVLECTYNDGTDPDIPYDAITAITDVNGKTTTFDYDVLGRVTSVTIPADGQGGSARTWTYDYDENADHYDALQVTVTRPDTKSVVYQYNPNGTLAWVDAPDVGEGEDVDDMKTAFDYDGLGRPIKLAVAGGNVTLWSYDAAGRVLEETIEGHGAATNVTTYGYNPDSQVAHISDPLGQTFDYAYDDDNRLSSILMKDAALNETTKTVLYSWDTANRTQLWTVSVGSKSVEFKYNEYGLLDYVDGVLPAGTGGDPDKVTYGYDSDYRLSELGYAIYDTNQSKYVVWTTSYAYDTFGRLETIEDRLGLETEYAYNDDSTLKSLTLPNGTVTDYTYDDLRRLVSIATTGLSANDIIVKFTYQYNKLGLRDKVTMADGRTTEWDYDDVGRLVEEHFKSAGPSPTTLLRYVYTYDAAGNRTSKKTDYDDNDGNGFAATATYTNNGYNQLTGVSGSPGRGTRVNVTGTIPAAWTLADGDVTVTPNEGDPVPAEVRGRFFIARNVPLDSKADNSIVASTSATTLADHSPASDTVLDVSLDRSIMWTFAYNANGDLTQKLATFHDDQIEWDYTYSVDGWLTKAEKKVNGETEFTEEYLYDPIGRKYKIATTEGAESTERYFACDGGSILLELDAVGEGEDRRYELDTEYVRGPSLGGGIGGLLYTRDADGTTGYFHYDGQGNVVSITDEAREEIAYYEYDAWGNILTACGSLANEFRHSTKQASTGTGLIDFGYRWYDSSVGRWTQRDPIGMAGGVNLYGYVGQDPVNYVDCFGLAYDPMRDTGSIAGSAGGSGSWDGAYNPLAGTMRVANAGVNGFFDALAEDPVLHGIHGAGQVVIGVILCYGGAWPLGAPMVAMGLSNLADAVSQATGNGSFNPVREGGEAILQKVFGATPEEAAILWSWLELNFDVAGGTCAISYLRGRPGESARGECPEIKEGSAGGPSAGRDFPGSVKAAARTENPSQTCVYCRRPGTAGHVDHAIPKAGGGDATLSNAQLACPHCNMSKGAGEFPKTPPRGYRGEWPPEHWGN
jgi:RHS repeat-associated protein